MLAFIKNSFIHSFYSEQIDAQAWAAKHKNPFPVNDEIENIVFECRLSS